ncbi:ABC transporter permease subunit [Metabacillus sp. 84]|uniref:ABC transporter permease subunit n=1 Tax=Metabacillus sp. 84 TaxID=3404705 RepID=UPI003CF297F4
MISFAVSILFASAAVLFLKKRMNWIKRMILAAEAIPDIFIITVLQALVIYIYKQTDVLIVKVASLGDEKSYVLPLICLGIPASVYLVKILIKTIEEEGQKAYVELAKAIGTSPVRILIFHISRNAFHKIMINSKTLVWSLLASMLIIEYVFNYPGMLSFLLTYRSPEVFLMAVTILFLPFFVIYQSYFLFAPDLIKGEKG